MSPSFKTNLWFVITLIIILNFSSCLKEDKLFQKLSSKKTKVFFNNTIIENDTLNILNEEYVFNGGGLISADFNNDGKKDLFFSGNQVSNKLYLNHGDFIFKDISKISRVEASDKWSTGSTYSDVNNDGLLDIYVCAAMKKGNRKNMLFINKGIDAEIGEIVFEEMASQYGIDDSGNSMGAVFFDYNKDGFLDLYVINNEQNKSIPTNYRKKIIDGSAVSNDKLYKNNGNGSFTDVTLQAGITIEGFGLGIAISDINYDGWPDIYVTNDYTTNDLLYINNQDGTFSNKISTFIKHQSMFSMGVDISDFNNDGYQDIISLDMLGESNYRKKTTISFSSYEPVVLNKRFGYETQHSRNMLQIGNGSENPFSEIGMLADVYQTDWSWSPLFFDADNDGLRDLFITNGFPRDITDKDFSDYRLSVARFASTKILLDSIPIIKQANYSFKNNGDLTFSDISNSWGLDIPSFSNGAVYSDLDNDGDLDYIVNNINDEAFIFENQNENQTKNNYLQIDLKGPYNNITGIGAKVVVRFSDDTFQFHENYHTRGYMSSVDNTIHFGMGSKEEIKSLEVLWPDGNYQKLDVTKLNQRIKILHSSSNLVNLHDLRFPLTKQNNQKILIEVSKSKKIDFTHKQIDKADFSFQRLIPRKISENSPRIIKGDLNGDKIEDFIIIDEASPKVYIQSLNGDFKNKLLEINSLNEKSLISDIALIDIDKDEDLDLIVLINKSDFEKNTFNASTQILLNNGKGSFQSNTDFSNEDIKQGKFIRPNDFDNDGDMDLFIGGKILISKYPISTKNKLFKNENGIFVDVTDDYLKNINLVGIPKDAAWVDINQDGLNDLILVSEFSPIQILINHSSSFKLLENTGLEKYSGWWESIKIFDNDNDGDFDFLVGNIGSNNHFNISEKTPLSLLINDFDENGSIDPILFSYSKNSEGELKEFPVTFWGNIKTQSPIFRQKFNYYKQYAKADISKIFTEQELIGSLKWIVNYDKTAYVENLGKGKFILHPLPNQAQFAPVFDFEISDFNNDNHKDILLIGNDYGNEPFIGPYDALCGLMLLGDGNKKFNPLSHDESGFCVPGNARSIVKVKDNNKEDLFLVSQNSGVLLAYKNN
jgi:hypothetical protein